MIKAIIIDDEWYNLEEISDLIDNTGLIKIVGKYQNPRQVLEEFKKMSPEVAFIDIELGEIDGITLAKQLLEINPEIIIAFITSWDKYAIDAFDINATDYILKPIRMERFLKMIDKIINKVNKQPEKLARVRIQLFDKFEVKIDGTLVKWKRTKSEELFAFLLLNYGSYIHKDTIIENLWTDYDPDKALRILQTTIYSIRSIFSGVPQEVVLEYSQSRYKLAMNGVWCDYLELEKSIEAYKINDMNTYIGVEKSARLFTKELLMQQGYLWSAVKEEGIRKNLTLILEEIASKYSENQKVEDEIRVLTLIATILPYEDDINYRLIKGLKDAGDNIKAFNHYKWLEKTLNEEYGLIPSPKIRNLIN